MPTDPAHAGAPSSSAAAPHAAHASPTVLIVDDDQDFARSAADFARSYGYTPYIAHSLEQSRGLFPQLAAMDLLLLDLDLPDGSGFELLDEDSLPERGQIAIVTGHPSVETAARAVARPIMEYLVKPLVPEQFGRLLDRAAARGRGGDEGAALGMIGRSPAMQRLAADLRRIAPSTLSVLLSGESGTGKELAAHALHGLSGRDGAFVAVNCGAIAPDLLASHLFGHERGSFTGAAGRHSGYFEQAHGGTLFLDEITEMSPALQVYLLRVLESGALTRVGGAGEIAIDVRVVAACNRDPLRAIDEGALREDLYYRLADVHIELPPLRSRSGDALLIARATLDELNASHGGRKRLAAGSERTLAAHPWPGNVRELRSAVRRAFLTTPGDEVRIVPGTRRLQSCAEESGTIRFNVGMSYAEVEREMLLKTLAHFGQDRTRTARALGVSVRTVHNQIARLREDGCEVE